MSKLPFFKDRALSLMHMGQRPRRQLARGAHVGRVGRSTAGEAPRPGLAAPGTAAWGRGLCEGVAFRGAVTAVWGPSWYGRWGAARRSRVPSPVPNKGLHLTAGSLVSLRGDVGESPSPSPWT